MTPVLPALALLAAAPAAPPPGLVRQEFVYESAPFPSCHASTLAETKAGLVAAWFGGTRERHPDVGVWVARQEGGRWTAPVEVAAGVQTDGTRHPTWNPVLFQPAGGPLLLFYKVGPSPQTWWGELRTSGDAGRTWSAARRLPDGVLGPVKNKPVQLADGSLLCPSSTESVTKPSAWRLRFERTADLGRTWTASEPASPGDPPVNAIQPSLLVHPGGKLQAVGRTAGGKLFTVRSDDGGKSWGPVGLLDLPNPNSGTDAVTLADGRHLLVYNHTARKPRSPLNIAVSRDGTVWKAALELEHEQGEFSYPAVIQTADGLIHVMYTWHRKRIAHAVIDPAKLSPVDMAGGDWPKDAPAGPGLGRPGEQSAP